MASIGLPESDIVAWVRKVNRRWIVHHELQDSAEAYLLHLALADPDRVIRSCERAQRLVRICGPANDPKPWFYAGLFSLATPGEAARFLKDHWFTAACIPALDGPRGSNADSPDVADLTRERLKHIRDAVARL